MNRLLRIIVLLLAMAFTARAMAWGQSKEFNESDWRARLLSSTVVTAGRIRYCVRIAAEASRFNRIAIEEEVQTALRVWLKPVVERKLIPHEPKILLQCNPAEIDRKSVV